MSSDIIDKKTLAADLEQAQNFLMSAGELINKWQYYLKPTVTGQPKPQQTQQPTSNPNTNTKKLTIEDVQAALPAELVPKLDIAYRAAGTVIIVKPIAFLGSDNFSKMAQVSRNFGGEYISAGKDSRFEIKITQGGQ